MTVDEAQAAVREQRLLVEREPDDPGHRYGLASALFTLATVQRTAGDPTWPESVWESIGLLEDLATAPVDHAAVASLLVYLGTMVTPEQAITPTRTAVTLYREVAADGDPGHRESLAWALHNLALRYSAAADPDDAAIAAREAITITVDLLTGPGDPAGSASQLIHLATLVPAAEAVAPTMRAVEVLRGLPASRAALAWALHNLALRYTSAGDPAAAAVAAREAITVTNALLTEPGDHAALASQLVYLATLIPAAEAVVPTRTAVDVLRGLAGYLDPAVLNTLSWALHNLALRCSAAGAAEESAQAAREAVAITLALAEETEPLLTEWLPRLRHHWRAALAPGQIRRISDGTPADSLAVDVLARLPVATDLLIRRIRTPREALDHLNTQRPHWPGPVLSVGGVPAGAGARWAVPTELFTDLAVSPDTGLPDPAIVPARIAPAPEAYGPLFAATAELLADIQAVLAGTLPPEDYQARWPMDDGGQPLPERRPTLYATFDQPELVPAVVLPANWEALQEPDDGDPVRAALLLPPLVDAFVGQITGPSRPPQDEIDGRRRELSLATAGLPGIIEALRRLEHVAPDRFAGLLLEVVDVFSHRLDAWITSLPARRLAALRAAGRTGVRLGGYGWVEDLRRGPAPEIRDVPGFGNVEVAAADGYVHTPSPHHAATAAVLRSGFLAHEGEQTFAVDLTSARARSARWLLGGVRRGQHLGSLLGYRFERSLHEAGLDRHIPAFRPLFPAPVVPEPSPSGDDLWSHSTDAIAANNVVDGLALARAHQTGCGLPPAASLVVPQLDALVELLDAVGDLLLAESVHQLVGGNALRAGLTADTLGGGTDVPDRFDVLRTPHRGRAITHRVAAVISGTSPWPADILSALEPAVETWVAALLGPPSTITVTAVVEGTGPVSLTADGLGLSALSLVREASGTQHPRLDGRVAALTSGPFTYTGAGWAELRARAVRIRGLLAGARPLPRDTPEGVSEVQARLVAFTQTDPARLAELGVTDLAGLPTLAADPAPDDSWLHRVTVLVADLLGFGLPLLPPDRGLALLPAAGGADVAVWLDRWAEVRPSVRAFTDILDPCGQLLAVQSPAGGAWIGGPFTERPAARQHLVCHLPHALTTEATACLLLDEWSELLPGAETLGPAESELTGLAFHFDRPDAKAPQAILLAVPPDPTRGWTADGLLLAVHDALELAKLRAVDLADLPLLDDLLPGPQFNPFSVTGRVLGGFEQQSGFTNELDPFTGQPRYPADDHYRMEPLHRAEDVVEGLAARVHDATWLLTRQWQFGEFTGQDAGSPVDVRVSGSSSPVAAWRPPDSAWIPYTLADGPLDRWIEQEPPIADERDRTLGGALLVRMLSEAGQADQIPGLLASYPLTPSAPLGEPDAVSLLAGRVPDAATVASAVDQGHLTGEVAATWRAWWSRRVPAAAPDTFDPHRLEHRFSLSAGDRVLTAPEFHGDDLDWFGVDIDTTTTPAPATPVIPLESLSLASPVRYGGIPADRFWEMEDAQIDLGATDVSTLDTGRLLLIGFATVYGNDWFSVPLLVPAGTFTTLDRVLVKDTFGHWHLIQPAGRDDPSWNLFNLTGSPQGLLLLPTAPTLNGPVRESIVLARDEMANLAWAVESSVTDPHGEPLDRREHWLRTAPPAIPTGPLPAYAVQSIVPDYWLPLVPQAQAPGVVRFRLVPLHQPGTLSAPQGRLLTPGAWLHEEELPREGVTATRRPILARWYDGTWHAWTRREKSPGTGESASGLAFDTVRPTAPWPN